MHLSSLRVEEENKVVVVKENHEQDLPLSPFRVEEEKEVVVVKKD